MENLALAAPHAAKGMEEEGSGNDFCCECLSHISCMHPGGSCQPLSPRLWHKVKLAATFLLMAILADPWQHNAKKQLTSAIL